MNVKNIIILGGVLAAASRLKDLLGDKIGAMVIDKEKLVE